MDQIKTVAVIGTGVIGSSWAALFLGKGLKVIISDPASGAKERFAKYIEQVWSSVERTGLGAGASKDNYEFADDITSRLGEVDFVQENGPERVEVKNKIVGEIDAHTRSDVIIASSSSGLPSSEFLKECKKNADRVLIGHPFNPPHLMPLVEIVPHPKTDKGSIEGALAFYKNLGKTPILIQHEVPGFVANRLQAAINNEAYSLVSRGIISARDLDVAMTNGPGLRWALNGPLETNGLGGGGGAEGFNNRLDRLGEGIRGWEKDIFKHHFDWSDEATKKLKDSVKEYLDRQNPTAVKSKRDTLLLEVMSLKTEK